MTLDLCFLANLRAALWLQFAQDVTQSREVRLCPYCGKRNRRAMNAKWCSPSCRVLASREKMKLEKMKFEG